MRGKRRRADSDTGVLHRSVQNLPHQPQLCFEGESLSHFLKSVQREIESVRALDAALPLKLWIKLQFAVGVNEVTRALERMQSDHGTKSDSDEHFKADQGGDEAPCVYLQAILLASDCNPRWLTKHLPALAASRNVPIITVKDTKKGSLRLGELIKMKTAIAIGIKAKGSAVNQLIKESLNEHKIAYAEA